VLEASRNLGDCKIGHGNSASRKRGAESLVPSGVSILRFLFNDPQGPEAKFLERITKRKERKKEQVVFCLSRREAECGI
jgi:hypothetical protein